VSAVAHATWGADRRLHLWAEDRGTRSSGKGLRTRTGSPAHPFAASRFEIPQSEGQARSIEAGRPGLELELPAAGDLPRPSWDAVDPGIAVETHPSARWWLPTAPLGAWDALRLLARVPEGEAPGVGLSVRFFSRVTILAIELVARGRFLPWIEGDDNGKDTVRVIWQPAHGAADVGRISTLAGAMPGVCLAGRDDLHNAPDGRRRAVGEVLGELVNAFVREAAEPLAMPGGQHWLAMALRGIPLQAREAVRTGQVFQKWALAVRPAEGPFRVLFRLSEPGRPVVEGEPGRPGVEGAPGRPGVEGAPGRSPSTRSSELEVGQQETWRLELLMGAREDPSVVVPARDMWSDPAALRSVAGADPEEALLLELDRASRLYPPLDAVLEQATPSVLDLDTAGAHAFLGEGAPLLADAGYTVLLPAWWRRRRRLGLRLRVRARSSAARPGVGPGLGTETLVDYDWRVAVGDADLTEAELDHLARLKQGLVRVRGEWVEIGPGELDATLRAIRTSAGGGARPLLTVADVIGTALGILRAPGDLEVTGVTADGWLGAILGGDDGTAPAPIPAPPGFDGRLRSYQERGLGWMSFLDRLGFGGILADEMGLGKTAQLLALLVAEVSNVPAQEQLGPTLVVCPMSVVGNWQREASRFAPGLRVHVHHGAGRGGGQELAAAVRDADLVITTYTLAARDQHLLETIPWRRIVLDEAQEIKNSDTAQSRAVRSLRAPSRFALTGTPIENRLTELWTIMDFANPGLLGTEAAFRARYSLPIERYGDERAADRLHRLTTPFVLRRVKTDRTIAPDLPDKIELTTPCGLTREQATLYQAVVDELMPGIERETDETSYRGKVLLAILRLKQVCNHPALFLGDGSSLRGRSGKLERLEEILDQVLASGERALLFTQFTEWAERLVPYLRDRFGREVLYLHGGLPRLSRDELVMGFEAGRAPIFVLSLKAGGKGLNLVAANHVIHFDRWWNPAVEDQASDRAYRIGQTRDVVVRTFVATGTLEEKVAEMLAAKRDLATRIVRSGERAFTEMSARELRQVLTLASDAVVEDT
jgi:non-specific serine/threonine protein kinase